MATICVELCKTGQIAKAELQPVDYKFLPLIACTERQDVQNYNKQHQNDKPSKSFIQGGNETGGEFLKDEDYGKNREYSIYELITNSADNKKIELEITLQSGSRRCYYDETMYISTKVTGETAKNKIKKVTIDKEGNPLKYNEKLKLTIETTLKEGESLSFYVDFYARKKTTDKEAIHCGRMKFIIKGKCFCNRDFTVQELQKIITYLRKEEDFSSKLKMYDGTKDLLVAQTTYDMEPSEKFSENESTYRVFTKMLNDMFRKYEINTCARKIHFLAQSYAETDRFRCSVECTDVNKYDGYIGRGFIHLTRKIAYFKYFNYRNNYKYIPAVIENDKSKENRENEETFNSFPKIEAKIKEFNLENKLYEFRTQLATSMWSALDSAGWYWRDGFRKSGFNVPDKKGDINLIADETGNGDITEITKSVNGGLNGLEKRKLYTKLLMDKYYDKCKNKK